MLKYKTYEKNQSPKGFTMPVSKICRFAREKYLVKKQSPLSKVDAPIEIQVFKPYDLDKKLIRRLIIRELPQLGQDRIDELFRLKKVNYQKYLNVLKYLPLELFEDTLYNSHTNEEISLRIMEKGYQSSQILVKSSHSEEYNFIDGIIMDYSPSRGVFKYKTMKGQIGYTHRIYFILQFENPLQYIRKIQIAFKNRIYMDSLLRYNHYIDNMCHDDVVSIQENQFQRIKKLLNCSFSADNMQQLCNEVKLSYIRSQNQIQFDAYLNNKEDQIFSQDLVLPKVFKKEVPFKGSLVSNKCKQTKMMIINGDGSIEFHQKTFQELQRDLDSYSLYSSKEVIKALVKIKLSCLEILNLELFYLQDHHSILVDQLKQLQEHVIKKTVNHLKNVWVIEIIEIIKTELNLDDKKSPVLSGNKIDRFYELVRIVMQDTLVTLIKSNLVRLNNHLAAYICDVVIIKGQNIVQNVRLVNTDNKNHVNQLHDLRQFNKKIEQKYEPLFIIDISLTPHEDGFCYSFANTEIFNLILGDFDKVLEALQFISDPNPLILDKFYISKVQGKLITPIRSDSNFPEKHDPQNQWLQDIYESMQSKLNSIAEPMQVYLNHFDQFKVILRGNLEKMVSQCFTGEHINFNKLASIIEDQLQIEKELATSLPSNQIVSAFGVRVSSLTNLLIQKQNQLIQAMIEFLALKAIEMTKTLLQEFSLLQIQIKSTPFYVEEITEMNEYLILQVPVWLELREIKISQCTQAYNILDQLQFQMKSDDIVNRWTLFGQPYKTQCIVQEMILQLDQNKAESLSEKAETLSEQVELIQL